MRLCNLSSCVALLLLAGFIARHETADANDAPTRAAEILKQTGITGGLIVHLGCGNGELTAALRASDCYTVHGLETDPSRIVEARKQIQFQGLYGPVSVERLDGSTLPYNDNLINLVVAESLDHVSMSEIMRVLVPQGVAYVNQDGTWQKWIKPRPADIDEWSHFLHDASNNAVAQDTVVGPPRSLQWLAPPLWLRSHETPAGIQSPVSAGGRLFYFFDQGLIGITDERLPERWSLVCRDAFNGKLLWEQPLDAWGWKAWNPEQYAEKDWTKLRGKRTNVPAENQRKIVVDQDRVYTTLSYGAPLSILDAATGKMITTVNETRGASEILVSEGVALTYAQNVPEDVARRRGVANNVKASLVAIDGKTGQVLWKRLCGSIRSTLLAIENGRIVFLSGRELFALRLRDGRESWKVTSKLPAPKTLLCYDNVIVMQGGTFVVTFDALDGKLLWQKNVNPIRGAEGDDLFVVDQMVWRGITSVDDEAVAASKTPNALVIGWDLRTGQEKHRILVNNLRSPEHHHRCYRNKATARYLISSHEGAEFLDFEGDNHGQNNWIRGVCKNGMMPCNGMLYVPPDQCFCQPGAKLLGYAALTAGQQVLPRPPADDQRLFKGPAFAAASRLESSTRHPRPDDWPTYRHDAARSGTTSTHVPASVSVSWKMNLNPAPAHVPSAISPPGSAIKLTAPVVAGDRLFVASCDSHTVHAIDTTNGKMLWQFTASGRVDSPPTIYRDLVLFGSRDGRVYCLRAKDGELVWRFLAAPVDRRIAHFDQIESTWPVHGSVLIEDGVAYFAAGRSTYLDGGIHLYGLDPVSGDVLYQGLLEGPHREVDGQRDLGFFLLGANSDVLVSEGGFIYMRQKKMTPELEEIDVEVLSSKGAQDVGLHIFSTSGMLDDSWYNRTYWMYSKRWPGFQLANQAPKSGQLLVVDEQKTYAVRVFYRRNVHSPMFFPGKEGYLLFADANTNEPQIVGEVGSRPPVEWLPQSDYSRGRGDEVRELESEAFGLDKMIGYTRAEPPVWSCWLPVRIQAMVKAGDTLFVAGPPDVLDPDDPYAAFEGRKGATIVAVSAANGAQQTEMQLESPPVFDGMIAADGRLFVSQRDGSVVCLEGN